MTQISPYFTDGTRIRRQLKKQMKYILGSKFHILDNLQRRWYYMYLTNRSHHEFLINKILQKN